MSKPFVPTNREQRNVMTPDGIATLDFITDKKTAWVWLGERHRGQAMREHREYGFEELREVER